MQKPLHDVEKLLARAWPPGRWHGVTVVVAVSGGADSVALLRALCMLRQPASGRLLLAHLNHHLRGEDSDQDEAFVRRLAESLACPVFVGHAGSLTSQASDGLEAAARQARYQFLRQVADREGARYVALGHTFDDQAETILHRIVRGTGIAGLAGMPFARPLSPLTTIVRPLLAARRHQLRAYLEHLGQDFREDFSNAECQFTRNRIRHELIPFLETHFNSNASEAVVRLGRHACQLQQVIDNLVDELLQQHVQQRRDQVTIDCPPLAQQPRYILCELLIAVWKRQEWSLQAMGGQKWEQVAALLCSANPATLKICLPGNVVVQRIDDQLLVSRDQAGEAR